MKLNVLEKFSGIFLIAGLVLFIGAIVGLAVVPVWMIEKTPGDDSIATAVPADYQAQYPTLDLYKAALFRGRDIYIAEACWHCHSQYVRPTANENLRYGPVSTAGESQNRLNLPQLFGTRRVGPDLSREGGKRTNDWHYAHLYKPTNVEPQSVMPQYPWFFDIKDGVPVPNADGQALVAYLQWLGNTVQDRKENAYDYDQETLPPAQ